MVDQRERPMGMGSGTPFWLHGDHLGGATLTTNTSGAKQNGQEYGPWGNLRSGDLPETTIDFTGQRRDDTGLLYYGARYYDPVLGRFLSADPIGVSKGDPQTLNRYAYALNNPVNHTDPTGHQTVNDRAWGGAAHAIITPWFLTSHPFGGWQTGTGVLPDFPGYGIPNPQVPRGYFFPDLYQPRDANDLTQGGRYFDIKPNTGAGFYGGFGMIATITKYAALGQAWTPYVPDDVLPITPGYWLNTGHTRPAPTAGNPHGEEQLWLNWGRINVPYLPPVSGSIPGIGYNWYWRQGPPEQGEIVQDPRPRPLPSGEPPIGRPMPPYPNAGDPGNPGSGMGWPGFGQPGGYPVPYPGYPAPLPYRWGG